MQCGNSAAVAVRRVDRRRVRDRVDGGDKEQQTDQPDGVFAFQSIPEQEEAIPLAKVPLHANNDITFGTKYRELYRNRICSRSHPKVTWLCNEYTIREAARFY
jgi:hypothetical protein